MPTDMDIIKERIVVSERIRNQYSVYSSFKTLSSLKYVLAGQEMLRKKADDIIIMDHEGNVSEALYSNVFWRKGNDYFTPSIRTGCIDGTMRKFIMQKLKEELIPVHETQRPIETLLDADQVFLTNSMGIFTVKSIEDRVFDDLRVPKQLLLP